MSLEAGQQGRVLTLSVPHDVAGKLVNEAAARKISLTEMLGRVLTHVAKDGLVSAVLDDGNCDD